jgi:hypothetical protein
VGIIRLSFPFLAHSVEANFASPTDAAAVDGGGDQFHPENAGAVSDQFPTKVACPFWDIFECISAWLCLI